MAAEIAQSYTVKVEGNDVVGTVERGDVALSCMDGMLRIFMTEESVSCECPPYELMDLMARHCSIGPHTKHRLLVSLALSDDNIHRIQTTFRKEGVKLNLPPPDDSKRTLAQTVYAIVTGWLILCRLVEARGPGKALCWGFR